MNPNTNHAAGDDAAGEAPALGVQCRVPGSPSIAAADQAELERFLADAERAVNTLQAAQAEAMLALADRAREADAALPVALHHLASRCEEGVVDQIAVMVHSSRAAAAARYEVAQQAGDHPALQAAWRDGSIDQRKVAVIADGVQAPTTPDEGGLSPATRDRLVSEAVEYATTHSPPQTRAWLTRRVIAIDPGAAERRHERASSRRHVRLHPMADGMAELSAYLPAVQARRAFDTLTAAAHSLDGPAERRTLEQRRADVLVDLVSGRRRAPEVHVSLTVDAWTLIGAAERPAELAGYGPVPAGVARKLLASADPVFRRLLTDPSGTVTAVDPARYRPTPGLEAMIRARDLTCRFPGCRRPATSARSGVDLDHTRPWPAGTTTPDNLAALCRHHHRVKHSGDQNSRGWALEQNGAGGLTWTTPGGHTYLTEPWHYTDPPPE